jgi:hypothetical protein
VVLSHSPLLDRQRSSMRILLNGTPVTSTSLKDISPTRGSVKVDLPASSLRAGTNSVGIELTFYLPRFDERQTCASTPNEQAWAVVHADSGFQPPAGGAPTTDVATLANYPFPFVRNGLLDQTLIVMSESLRDGGAFVRLCVDLGRAARGSALLPKVIKASEFSEAMAANKDVIVWGLPEDNPVLGLLGGRLPIQVDGTERLVLSRDLQLSVRDASKLGVMQQVGSPWTPGRSVLAVTGTSAEGLPLAVEALRQGNLQGNAALVSRAELQPAPANRAATPVPLVLGASRPEPLQVSTYRLRPQVEAPADVTARRPPYALAAGAVVGFGVLAGVLGLAYQAFGLPTRRPVRS